MPKRIPKKQEFIPLTEPVNTVEVEAKPRPKRSELEKIDPQRKLTGNSILIITEKPQASAKISAALSNGKAKQLSSAGAPYYEFERDGENIVVACAVGHLFSIAQDQKGSNYPIFDVSWHPNFEVRKKDFTKKYYQAISKLVKRAKEIIVATDYDTEGEVIGYNVVRFIANQPDAKRMKFSSLTAKELETAYEQREPTINWGQAMAGETRHYLDWFYGINLSRALMASIKSTGKFKIMSIGRVQGPALHLITDRENEISKFKSEQFWKIFITISHEDEEVRLKHTGDIFEKDKLPEFESLKGSEADVSTKISEKITPPLHPFDLTTLQTESYKFFGLTPSRTLQIAQQLYLSGLISYPRTSSQKIPEAINPKQILKRLSEKFPKVKLATRSQPIEGGKSDPAHPSIYPTGEFQMLEGDDKKVYELIVKRFISCFSSDAKIENKTVTATADNKKFKARGLEIKEKGWLEIYPAKMKEEEIPTINGNYEIEEVVTEEDATKPPRRYSPASILSELEKRNLGTKATRANILETLYDRKYITDQKSIQATPLGIHLINSLKKHSPIIIDEKLTREIEEEMEDLQKSKGHSPKEQEIVLNKAKTALKKISEDFHKHEKEIGKDLVKATEELWKQEAKENTLNQCPSCKKGNLIIKYSPRFKKSFVACSAYPDCKTTFNLPPGFIKKTEKNCEHCNFPIVMRVMRGKRPWFLCFNPNCPGKEEEEKEE